MLETYYIDNWILKTMCVEYKGDFEENFYKPYNGYRHININTYAIIEGRETSELLAYNKNLFSAMFNIAY